MQYSQWERRSFERLSLHSQVVITHNDREQKVYCKDVNTEGMSLYLLNHQIHLHDELIVRFDEHDSHLPALNVDAEVIRVQALEDCCLIVVEFTAIY